MKVIFIFFHFQDDVEFLDSTFLKSKEWSIYKNMTHELCNARLQLLNKKMKETFFVNLYNLLALEKLIKRTESVLRIQNEDFSMENVLKNHITPEGVFSLIDFTCQSPKFIFYPSKEQIMEQQKNFIQENVIISGNKVLLPQCFLNFIKMEFSTKDSFLADLKRFAKIPQEANVFIYDPNYSMLNVFDTQDIYKNPNSNFFFEKGYGVEVTKKSQYFGEFNGLKKYGKGKLFEFDSFDHCEFINDKKHGKGQRMKDNILRNVEWKENIVISENIFNINFRFHSNLQIKLQKDV
jgi:hypothetical protein